MQLKGIHEKKKKKKLIAMVLLDISDAFDSIIRNILISKVQDGYTWVWRNNMEWSFVTG